jgi:hypothetical protein
MSNNKFTDGYPPHLFLDNGLLDEHHDEYNLWLTRARYYGWTYDMEQGLFKFQNYKCPCCGEKLNMRKRPKSDGKGPFYYQLDHDHAYGESQGSDRPGLISVRGILCRACNDLLGKIENRGKNNPNFNLLEFVGRDGILGQYILNPPAQQFLKERVCIFA